MSELCQHIFKLVALQRLKGTSSLINRHAYDRCDVTLFAQMMVTFGLLLFFFWLELAESTTMQLE